MKIPDGWVLRNNALHRSYELDSYSECLELTVNIARIAEQQRHHPALTLEFTRVIVKTTTHDQNNTVTELDLNLATAINALFS